MKVFTIEGLAYLIDKVLNFIKGLTRLSYSGELPTISVRDEGSFYMGENSLFYAETLSGAYLYLDSEDVFQCYTDEYQATSTTASTSITITTSTGYAIFTTTSSSGTSWSVTATNGYTSNIDICNYNSLAVGKSFSVTDKATSSIGKAIWWSAI